MSEVKPETSADSDQPPGTIKVKLYAFLKLIDKKWFQDVIKNSFCLIPGETTKIGCIENIEQKQSIYKLCGKWVN